jgi:uncharacterized protein (DUF1800 family)
MYVRVLTHTHTHTQKQLKAKVEEAAKAKAEAEEAAAEATKKAAADANAQKEADAKEAKEKEAKEKEAKDKEAAEKEQVRDGDDAKAEKEAHTRITYACMFESYTHTHKSSWRPIWPSKALSRQRTLTRSGATSSVRCFCT